MRQFVTDKNPENGILVISGKDFRYLRQVLRLSVGDMFTVRLPGGILQNTTVAKIDDGERKITLQVCSGVDSENADSLNGENLPSEKLKKIWLFMFVPKPSKFEQIVRQATECGVERIIPVASEFSQKGADKMNFRGDRFARIIKEARQQSGSAVETSVGDVISVDELCEMWKNDGSVKFGCVLYERSDFTVSMSRAFAENSNVAELEKSAVVVGSEGGISPSEIEKLKNAGFVPVHFRTNILRCETAAIYGLSVLQNLIEEKFENAGEEER